MKKKRLIPVLLLKNGWLVQSKAFRRYQNIGNPVSSVLRMSEWASDELIYLDISNGGSYDLRRDDLRHANRRSIREILEDMSGACFMPVTIGGGIRSLDDIQRRLSWGADKVSLNTKAIEDPSFVRAAAREFGSQCVVVSIDVKNVEGRHVVTMHGGRAATAHHPVEWAIRLAELGAGEILVNSVDRDGMGTGYDLELLADISSRVPVPVIACGGVGKWEHLAEGLEQTNVDAVAAANIFHYTDQSVFLAKRYLYDRGLNVRQPDLLTVQSKV